MQKSRRQQKTQPAHTKKCNVSSQPAVSQKRHDSPTVQQELNTIIPYDENLLERSRTQWQFGDWLSLAQLNRDPLQHHPDRDKLALLAAAGRLQTGQDAEARQYIRLAQDWGVSKKLISQILIAGVYNSIGRAAAINSQQNRALQHFKNAIAIGTPSAEVKLITRVRTEEQLNQLGLYPQYDYKKTGTNEAINSIPWIKNIHSHLSSNRQRGPLLINSIPKSGTYLLSSLLHELGMPGSGLHFRNTLFWDFKDKPLDEIISNPDQYKKNVILNESIKNLKPYEFCLAHLEYNKETETLLESMNIRHIFLVRNLREALISSMRFISDKRRLHTPSWADELDDKKRLVKYLNNFGAKYLRSFVRQANWLSRPSVTLLKFEDLLGDNGVDVQASSLTILVKLANLAQPLPLIHQIMQTSVLGKKNRTFSGSRSRLETYWSDDAELIFIDNAGVAINQRFGYE
jgi:hypothetical protein